MEMPETSQETSTAEPSNKEVEELRKLLEQKDNELKKFTESEKKNREKALKEQQKYKELFEEREKELNSIQPKLQEYEGYVTKRKEQLLTDFGDDAEEIQHLDIKTLELLHKKIAKKPQNNSLGSPIQQNTQTDVMKSFGGKSDAEIMSIFKTNGSIPLEN